MTDYSHLDALIVGLSHEQVRLTNAKSQSERELRAVWVRSYEKQIADERRRLDIPNMTDDELLAALFD